MARDARAFISRTHDPIDYLYLDPDDPVTGKALYRDPRRFRTSISFAIDCYGLEVFVKRQTGDSTLPRQAAPRHGTVEWDLASSLPRP